MIQVSLKETVRSISIDNGTDLVNQTLRAYYEEIRISHQTSVARTLQQNDVVERRNCTLVEAAYTMLIFSKAPLFLWAEAVATACYTQNKSLIQKCHNKTLYELLHDIKPDLSYLHVFGSLCYPTNDGEDHVMASEQFSSGPGPKLLTHGTISSGLVPNIPSSTPYVPPTKNDREILFQPMFNEYFNPPPCVDSHVLAVIAPEPAVSIVLKKLTMILKLHNNNPYVDIPIPEPSSEDPILRSISTRHQLQDEALLCYFDAFLSFVKPKSYKDALTKSCSIKAMQEELNEFERLNVWELVPRPDRVMMITLKWIYKVKLDELGGVLKKGSFGSEGISSRRRHRL
ncbi:retrovirus-related pol polyprotein from transposon TNT 1-94 [Tanacetum coccineum]|uniref:Retrovirus-related pol polyprotein from transposon TNT 1-94 n=1 Tax=Tanacetum coccineum TaxID=301880 RepID=A0ABQ5I8U4_9ASTR